MAKTYEVFDHDLHGRVNPDVDHGRLFFDESLGKIVCSIHGDSVATDGSATRKVTEAQLDKDENGLPFYNQDKVKEVGDARLYRCTVCGQGTWSHLGSQS